MSPTTRQPGSSSRGVDGLGKPAAIGPLNSSAEPFLSSIRWKEDPQGWAAAIAVDSAT